MTTRRAILFTRIPITGLTKTRLMPFLSAEECREFHECCLQDELIALGKTSDEIITFYSCPQKTSLPTVFNFEDMVYSTTAKAKAIFAQSGDNIYERMGNAMNLCFSIYGEDPTVLFGCDIPQLNKDAIDVLYTTLESENAAYSPTYDEGYYAIGSNKFMPQLFTTQLPKCKCTNVYLRDIDDKYDFNLLYNERDQLNKSSFTYKFLKNFDECRFRLG